MDKIKNMIFSFHLSNAAKKLLKIFFIFLFIILVTIFIISSVIKGNQNKECNNLRSKIISYTDNYMDSKDLYPTLNGSNYVVDLSNLESNVIFKDKEVQGTVTYTKYNDEYVRQIEITNADYCSTKEFKNETDKYSEGKNNKVNVYFNYYTVESYRSKWTDWIPSSSISTELTDGVLLPLDLDDLPNIPDLAIVEEYVRETKDFYSYRDKRWRWYRNNIKYSDYSSTKPSGYTNKDTATSTYTEYSDWSLDYPDEYDYRTIRTKSGYRWYKEENGNKVYWQSGQYTVENIDGYRRDNDSEVRMYSYRDEIWRWYNGDTKRGYSGYSSEQPNSSYLYRDDSTLTYTNWSRYYENSRLTSDNKSYREEITDTHSRYLTEYKIRSFAILDNPVSLEELENLLNKSYEEILNDKTIDVEVIFKFQVEG